MKKTFGLLLTFALVFSFAACGTAPPASGSAPGSTSALSAPAADAPSETTIPATPRFANPSPELAAEAAAKYALFESIAAGMDLAQVTEILGEHDYELQYGALDAVYLEYYYEGTAARPACKVTIEENVGVISVRMNLPDNLDWLPVVKEPIPDEELADLDAIVAQPERGLVFDWTDYGIPGIEPSIHYIFFNANGDFVQERLSNAVLEWEYWLENGETVKEEYERQRDE